MSSRIPPTAARILDEGVLCHLAVRTSRWPHLTPVVYVLDGGRLWVTTARRSVKARTWRRDATVAGLVRSGDRSVSFVGVVTTYDALDPLSWPAATVAAPRLARAATRFSLKNARFFAGYAVDARRVPLAWTPPGRVFAAIRVERGLLMEEGAVALRWGDQPVRSRRRGPGADDGRLPTRRRRALDLDVPADVRERVGTSGHGVIAFDTDDGPSVVPAEWQRTKGGMFDVVPTMLPGSGRPVAAALTVDHASSWRAAHMAGMLLQGPAELLTRPNDPRTTGRSVVRLRPVRVVWWRGWDSGTIAAPRA